jgi:nucleotide-binding universal stress UspA family protein
LELKQAARKALEQTIAEKVPKNIAIETSIEIGKPADVILNYAKERRIELIVMSTHGRTGLSHLMIGSVAENIIRRSPIPTLIIPSVKE